MDGIFMSNQLKEALIFAIRRFLSSVQIFFIPIKSNLGKQILYDKLHFKFLHKSVFSR